MADAMYTSAHENFLNGSVSWTNDTIKAVLIDTASYTYDATDKFLSDIAAGAKVATSPALASKTATGGVAKAANTTLTSVPTHAACEAVVLFKDTGTASTSPLIVYLDEASSGLPVTPNGGDIELKWGTGANGIFAL